MNIIYTYIKRSRAKSTLSTILHFLHTWILFPTKTTDNYRNSTYVQYLTALTSIMVAIQNPKNTDTTPHPSGNGELPLFTKTPQPASTNYERVIAHAAEVKFIYNWYTTPTTIEFGSSGWENTVNLPIKHRKILIAIKLLDPLAFITIKDKVITNSVEFPVGTGCTGIFDVITDQNPNSPVCLSITIFTQH